MVRRLREDHVCEQRGLSYDVSLYSPVCFTNVLFSCVPPFREHRAASLWLLPKISLFAAVPAAITCHLHR